MKPQLDQTNDIASHEKILNTEKFISDKFNSDYSSKNNETYYKFNI